MIERASAGKSRLWPLGRSARTHWKGEEGRPIRLGRHEAPAQIGGRRFAMQVDVFTRNGLCAFPRPKVGLTLVNFLDRLRVPSPVICWSTSSPDRYSPSPMQSRPISTSRFTTSATTGTTCAATRAISSEPEGTGSRPTWLVRILCTLFFIGLLPWSLELFQSVPAQLQCQAYDPRRA